MIYILQYWIESELIDTEVKEIVTDNLDWLMDQVGIRNDNGEEWVLLIDKNIYVGGKYIANPEKKDLIVNEGCFTVGESREYRTVLTGKIKASKIYKEKGIDKLRDNFIMKYDIKKLKPTIIKR